MDLCKHKNFAIVQVTHFACSDGHDGSVKIYVDCNDCAASGYREIKPDLPHEYAWTTADDEP